MNEYLHPPPPNERSSAAPERDLKPSHNTNAKLQCAYHRFVRLRQLFSVHRQQLEPNENHDTLRDVKKKGVQKRFCIKTISKSLKLS